jgi:hypothetical protein
MSSTAPNGKQNLKRLFDGRLCNILDGCSRFLAHCDLQELMAEADIELILERFSWS